MKKLLLFIGLTVFTFSAFAEKVPAVVVTKSNGGWTAILNLYNYVSYTPADLSPTGVGQLECSGGGFTACRVPNCTHLTVNNGTAVSTVSESSKVNALQAAINNVIIQYEAAQEQNMDSAVKPNAGKGASIPSVYTKTIAFANNSGTSKANKTETYVVRGVVTASDANSSTMKIYIEKTNLLPSVSSN
ncbi:MAG: hypothetical protein IJK22_07505 [Bacteroidales bacterium]|nr:hypothetical protein [Bacteroidales bacterium]